jgi:hypothetical protein
MPRREMRDSLRCLAEVTQERSVEVTTAENRIGNTNGKERVRSS